MVHWEQDCIVKRYCQQQQRNVSLFIWLRETSSEPTRSEDRFTCCLLSFYSLIDELFSLLLVGCCSGILFLLLSFLCSILAVVVVIVVGGSNDDGGGGYVCLLVFLPDCCLSNSVLVCSLGSLKRTFRSGIIGEGILPVREVLFVYGLKKSSYLPIDYNIKLLLKANTRT